MSARARAAVSFGAPPAGRRQRPHLPPSPPRSERLRAHYAEAEPVWRSDLDLFIHGLPTAAAGDAKLREVVAALERAGREAGVASRIFERRAQTLTVVSEHPHRPVQIILKLYRSAAQVLNNFDIDACTVGW